MYPLIGLYPLERVFAHILTGHAMRALRSTRIISASAHPVSMQERVKSFPSVSGKASGSAGRPRTERGKLTVFDSRCANSFRGPQNRGFAATSQTWENAAQPSAPGLRQPPKGLGFHRVNDAVVLRWVRSRNVYRPRTGGDRRDRRMMLMKRLLLYHYWLW